MTDENITTLSFDELPPDDESAWEQFDSMTDEDENAVNDLDNPLLTEGELNQFKRTFYVKGKKVWEDEKTIGEWLAEKGDVPMVIPVDNDIAEWFHSQGGDFKAQINAVLRDYVEAHR